MADLHTVSNVDREAISSNIGNFMSQKVNDRETMMKRRRRVKRMLGNRKVKWERAGSEQQETQQDRKVVERSPAQRKKIERGENTV